MLELESMKSEKSVVNTIITIEPNATASKYRFGTKFSVKENTKIPDYSKPTYSNKIKFEPKKNVNGRSVSSDYDSVQKTSNFQSIKVNIGD